MDKKREELLAEKERLQGYVERAERYEHLLKNDDFVEYMGDLLNKLKRYSEILVKPPKVGNVVYNNETVTETGTGYMKTYQKRVPVVITVEDQMEHIKEYNYRMDELKLVLDLPEDIVRDSKAAAERIGQIDKILSGSRA